jgi:hypothetical protein
LIVSRKRSARHVKRRCNFFKLTDWQTVAPLANCA